MKAPKVVNATQADLDEILVLAKASFPSRQYDLLEAILGMFAYLMQALQNAKTSIARLRKLVFGARTERKATVLEGLVSEVPADGPAAAASVPEPTPDAVAGTGTPSALATLGNAAPGAAASKRRRGHGRNGVEAYAGAEVVDVELAEPASGQVCPQCESGRVYAWPPRTIVRMTGQPPIGATIYRLQQRRCRRCDALFTAPMPAGISAGPRHDDRCVCMLILMRYGYGMPSLRLESLQASLALPMPDSTQWDLIDAAWWTAPRVVHAALMREAAQGELLHNDDTPARILSLMAERKKLEAAGLKPVAKAINTSIVLSVVRQGDRERKVALFFTGHPNAGANLATVLAQRAAELESPMHMCDGLAANLPGEFATVLCNCLVHGRRGFVDLVDHFPDECRHVIEVLAQVYANDAHCREQAMSPEQRLAYHQAHSREPMNGLHAWMSEQLEQRRVEPNSSLGGALNYMLKRWDALTLFLRKAGAPLDNNVAERALKRAIRHRRNSLSFKTQHGAEVGDTFMSLIHTCELCGVNPFEYLQALLRHGLQVEAEPALWLPWNYHERPACQVAAAA
jgi:hypothetical protein